MDILKQELARKRKLVEDIRNTKGKKYVLSSELEENTHPSSTVKPTQIKIPESIQENNTINENLQNNSSTSLPPSLHTIPRCEVIRRLRERSEPILLFGETQVESMERLKQLEMKSPEGLSGLQNDFLKAIERLDKEYIESLVTHDTGGMQGSHGSDVSVTSSDLTYSEVKSLTKQLKTHKEAATDTNIILNILQFLISSWGFDLNDRSSDVKDSYEGKNKSAIYNQTISYMQPLLRSLKKKSISSDILTALKPILISLMQQEYIQANDAYLDMAIGNAAWPIGVTMVGIHARTGREKIFANNVAHVLNDETQRKYIQGLKRLMSYCQIKYPTEIPKSVE
ncbi:Pre-mRNA-splicing factor 18 isoform X2 [Oopsacas minuta]|uniref:Pre-mRNA-splicing factor 18 n=1 Tax=Oopsacas minuta TaxID=111878 RepID=A0AAV7KHB2_9METZ|nr:Pre-mRNA-splicing factor 18 isoform X2 [Oopsacas minuta]